MGVSMYAVAKGTGVNVMTLYGWANGRHRPIWDERLQKVIDWCYVTLGVVLVPQDFVE